jgi:hypothetical protein
VKTMARRLRRLEERLRPALRAVERYDPALADHVRQALAAAGFVAGPVESLAELWARSTGITCVELRVLLEQRAAGLAFE